MQKRSLMNYNIANRITTTWKPQYIPIVWLQWVGMFIPYLFALSISWVGSKKEFDEYTEYDKFWDDWHAKYDRYKTSDGTHKLNWIQGGNIECTCKLKIVNGASEEDALLIFQEHLNEKEPVIYDLSKSPAKYHLIQLKEEAKHGKS